MTVIRLSLGKAPRSALLLDDSALLGVLSTPIRTQWKGLPARRNLCIPRTLKLSLPCQPVVCSKIKFHYLRLPAADTGLVDLGSFRSTVVETLTSGPEAGVDLLIMWRLSTDSRPLEASSTDFG